MRGKKRRDRKWLPLFALVFLYYDILNGDRFVSINKSYIKIFILIIINFLKKNSYVSNKVGLFIYVLAKAWFNLITKLNFFILKWFSLSCLLYSTQNLIFVWCMDLKHLYSYYTNRIIRTNWPCKNFNLKDNILCIRLFCSLIKNIPTLWDTY